MMSVVTVASLDGSITVGVGGQMNTMPRSRRLSMSRSSWMIRLCSPAMTLWASSIVSCLGFRSLLVGSQARPVYASLVGPLVFSWC
jgi:hypothetical protein